MQQSSTQKPRPTSSASIPSNKSRKSSSVRRTKPTVWNRRWISSPRHLRSYRSTSARPASNTSTASVNWALRFPPYKMQWMRSFRLASMASEMSWRRPSQRCKRRSRRSASRKSSGALKDTSSRPWLGWSQNSFRQLQSKLIKKSSKLRRRWSYHSGNTKKPLPRNWSTTCRTNSTFRSKHYIFRTTRPSWTPKRGKQRP